MELNVNGTFRTVDFRTINAACASGYRNSLIRSGSIMLQRSNEQLANRQLCTNLEEVAVFSFDLTFTVMQSNVSNSFNN